MQEIRCKKCNKKLGMIDGNYAIKCPRCGNINTNATNPLKEIGGTVYMNTKKESVENERGTMP